MIARARDMFILLCLCALAGCGFHLRGNTTLAPPLQSLYLQTQDPYGQLTKMLRAYLTTSGIYLTETADHATTVLVILNEIESQALLSVSGTQQTRQYNLILTVNFLLTNPQGKILVPPQSVSETRSLTIQSDQILSSSNESANMYQQMRHAIVFDIMNRLSSQQIASALYNALNNQQKVQP